MQGALAQDQTLAGLEAALENKYGGDRFVIKKIPLTRTYEIKSTSVSGLLGIGKKTVAKFKLNKDGTIDQGAYDQALADVDSFATSGEEPIVLDPPPESPVEKPEEKLSLQQINDEFSSYKYDGLYKDINAEGEQGKENGKITFYGGDGVYIGVVDLDNGEVNKEDIDTLRTKIEDKLISEGGGEQAEELEEARKESEQAELGEAEEQSG